jgi:hypothetical protein
MATTGVADVLATATVVQPASVMESFSLSMQLTATDRTWSSLKIVAPTAAGSQTAGTAPATSDGPQRNPLPGSVTPAPQSLPVGAATPTAFLAFSGPQTGASTLLRGSMMATLQVTPAGVGALAESAGITRFIVVFN